MNFKEIIGHDFVKSGLIDTIKSKKISHAYIFDGAEGIGKLKCAKIFAAGILCEDFSSDLCFVFLLLFRINHFLFWDFLR